MKTILVPTQNVAAMASTLETAVLLAQRTGAYIEGIPAVVWRSRIVVAELASGFSMEVYRARREDETVGARKLFETFMQQHEFLPPGRPRTAPGSAGSTPSRRAKPLSAAMAAPSM